MFSKLIILILFVAFETSIANDYAHHPCHRDCVVDPLPKTCIYDFKLEYYTTLNRNCYNCLNKNEDCSKPHCVAADGVVRAIKVANRMMPGPAIEVCKNDMIVVNVKNMLGSYESTSLHWHGIKQLNFPFMDGVGGLTQCPIRHGSTFQYKFRADNAGTHFWHAHSSHQRADGLFGALIVRDRKDSHYRLYDRDMEEHIVILNDWSHKPMVTKYTEFVHNKGDEKISSILINGKGINISLDPDAPQTPREVFSVKAGLRYRFRVINAGFLYCPLEVSIENHDLKLIALDGNPIQPSTVSSFNIMAGERVDFVLHADKKLGHYWFKVKGNADCAVNSVYQTAVLRYYGIDKSIPPGQITYENSAPSYGLTFNPGNTKINSDNSNRYLGVADVHSLKLDKYCDSRLKPILEKVDKKFYFGVDMNFVANTEVYDEKTFKFYIDESTKFYSPQINNITFRLPKYPVYYQEDKNPREIFCNKKHKSPACSNDDGSFCECTHLIEINYNEVIELVLVDAGTNQENHPFHLHGHEFAVIGMDKLGEKTSVEAVKNLDRNYNLPRNLKNPPLKDTIQIPSGGYTIIRFQANNPGYWLFHCHIEFHSEAGMALVFKVGGEKSLPPKPKNWPQCGDFVDEKFRSYHDHDHGEEDHQGHEAENFEHDDISYNEHNQKNHADDHGHDNQENHDDGNEYHNQKNNNHHDNDHEHNNQENHDDGKEYHNKEHHNEDIEHDESTDQKHNHDDNKNESYEHSPEQAANYIAN